MWIFQVSGLKVNLLSGTFGVVRRQPFLDIADEVQIWTIFWIRNWVISIKEL